MFDEARVHRCQTLIMVAAGAVVVARSDPDTVSPATPPPLKRLQLLYQVQDL